MTKLKNIILLLVISFFILNLKIEAFQEQTKNLMLKSNFTKKLSNYQREYSSRPRAFNFSRFYKNKKDKKAVEEPVYSTRALNNKIYRVVDKVKKIKVKDSDAYHFVEPLDQKIEYLLNTIVKLKLEKERRLIGAGKIPVKAVEGKLMANRTKLQPESLSSKLKSHPLFKKSKQKQKVKKSDDPITLRERLKKLLEVKTKDKTSDKTLEDVLKKEEPKQDVVSTDNIKNQEEYSAAPQENIQETMDNNTKNNESATADSSAQDNWSNEDTQTAKVEDKVGDKSLENIDADLQDLEKELEGL